MEKQGLLDRSRKSSLKKYTLLIIKKNLFIKENIKGINEKVLVLATIFAVYKSGKGPGQRIYNKLLQPDNKITYNPVKVNKRLEQILHEKDQHMAKYMGWG